jgi:hypothetical protein
MNTTANTQHNLESIEVCLSCGGILGVQNPAATHPRASKGSSERATAELTVRIAAFASDVEASDIYVERSN